MAKDLKGIPVAPLTGVLDARSNPDALPAGGLRYRQNFQTNGQNKLRRGSGWQKLLSGPAYNNEDFHDQLLVFTDTIRQPPTLLFEAVSTRRTRSLILATQGTIAQLNEYSGNWRILGSGFGGDPVTKASAPRFKAAQVGDFLAFTNDFESPRYHQLESNSVDPPPLLKEFDDFALIGLSRAAVVWAWHDCLFFADVEMDNERFSSRLLWSNYKDPTSFDPAKLNSIAGSKDLFAHERILAGMPGVGNTFLIYTTHGIWEMSIVGGEQSFAFRRVYNGEENEGVAVLKYPNTLVQVGDGHMYGAEDGIYKFNQYGRPDRVEWLHRASSLVYDQINTDLCQVHVAIHTNNELLFSVARIGAADDCPDITLRVNTKYNMADVIDHGFTAFTNYRSYRVPTIRDFIIENGICTVEDLVAAGYGWENEGLPRPIPSSSAPFDPQSIYTSTPQTIEDVTPEDWNQPEADEDSLCALLGNKRMDDFCRKCEGKTLLVAASSQEWCLKQLGTAMYRERCANPTAVGVENENGYASAIGSYILDGYDSILRFAPMYTTAPGQPMVRCEEVKLFYEDVPQDPPSTIGLRVGISGQPKDPNVEGCGIIWHQHSSQPLKCLTAKTEAQHKAKNTQPVDYASWNIWREGRYLHVELKMSGTGGDATFSSVVADAKLTEATNY